MIKNLILKPNKAAINKLDIFMAWSDEPPWCGGKETRAGIRIRVRQEFVGGWNTDLVLMLKAAQLCLRGTGLLLLGGGHKSVSASRQSHNTDRTHSLIHHTSRINGYSGSTQLLHKANHQDSFRFMLSGSNISSRFSVDCWDFSAITTVKMFKFTNIATKRKATDKQIQHFNVKSKQQLLTRKHYATLLFQ